MANDNEILFELNPADDRVLKVLAEISAKLTEIKDKGLGAAQALNQVFTPKAGYIQFLDNVQNKLKSIGNSILSVAKFAFTGEGAGAVGGLVKKGITAVAGEKAGNVAGAVGGIGGTLAGGVGAAVGAFTELTGKIQGFVAAASPAVSLRLDYAFQDLAATIGTFLTPIVDAASGIVEKFADVLAGLNIGSYFESLGKMLGSLGDVFNSLFQALSPVLELLANVGKALVDFFTTVFGWLADQIKLISSLFGIKAAASGGRTRAAGGVSVLGLDDISRRAQEAAGRTGTKGILEQIEKNTRPRPDGTPPGNPEAAMNLATNGTVEEQAAFILNQLEAMRPGRPQ